LAGDGGKAPLLLKLRLFIPALFIPANERKSIFNR